MFQGKLTPEKNIIEITVHTTASRDGGRVFGVRVAGITEAEAKASSAKSSAQTAPQSVTGFAATALKWGEAGRLPGRAPSEA